MTPADSDWSARRPERRPRAHWLEGARKSEVSPRPAFARAARERGAVVGPWWLLAEAVGGRLSKDCRKRSERALERLPRIHPEDGAVGPPSISQGARAFFLSV